MKFILRYTLLLLVITSSWSCEGYLDITPENLESSENYFKTPEEYEAAVIGVYDLLGTTYLNMILGEIASDNALAGGENATDVLDWQQIDDMTHNPDNGALRTIFQSMYAGISRANFVMEFRDNIDFSGKESLLAEVKFLRAYYYFELTKYFGGVPMYIDKRISVDETQTIERSSKAEVTAQIIKDLNEAISNLPWKQSIPGRVTKGAALALLGKVYLYNNQFKEAATTLEQVITSGNYDLETDFSTIFLNSNENNIESVFEVQYYGKEGAGFGCFQCSEGNIAVGFMGPRFKSGDYSPYADGFSFSIPTQELYSKYLAEDVRRDVTIYDITKDAAERGFEYAEGYEHNGYFNKKYIPYAEGNVPDQHLTHSNNYRAIRFADVLLMAAEAYNRSGLSDSKARTYLNRVRLRAGLTPLDVGGAALTQSIWNERRLELAGEGHRFFDLVRTGNGSQIPNFTPGKNELFPLPRIEIELAGNRWSQNPGY